MLVSRPLYYLKTDWDVFFRPNSYIVQRVVTPKLFRKGQFFVLLSDIALHIHKTFSELSQCLIVSTERAGTVLWHISLNSLDKSHIIPEGGRHLCLSHKHTYIAAELGSSVGCALYLWSGGREFAALVWQHSFVEIDHEIFSTVILSLPLIQEGKLSVTCERMCTEYWLTA